MERTKLTLNQKIARIQTLASSVVARSALASRMGMQSYGGERDLYKALGYPLTIMYLDYFARYSRQDMAKAIIDRPCKLTWKGKLEIIENKDDKETGLEKAWKDLEKAHLLKNKFSRIDRLAGIGCFGVLLLGLDDVRESTDFQKPVTPGNRKLKYVKPFGENNARISSYESDTTNPRYGKPLTYDITITDASSGTTISPSATNTSSTVIVHYSRIIHIVDDLLENETIGIPRLESVFNRLMDLEKLVGGDSEMFWRGARPGYQANVDKDYTLSTEAEEDLKTQIEEYENNLRRMLVNKGISYSSLDQQIADPSNHVDIQIQMISAVTGIPKRILTGTERGELSSSQDSNEWKGYIQDRRDDHAEPHIIRPFVDRCIELGILPKPTTEDYQVDWSDLYAQSEKEKVDVGKTRSAALKDYTSSPTAEAVVPPQAFMEFFLGLSQDQIDLIKEMKKASELQDQNDMGTEDPLIEPDDLIIPELQNPVPAPVPPIPAAIPNPTPTRPTRTK